MLFRLVPHLKPQVPSSMLQTTDLLKPSALLDWNFAVCSGHQQY